MKKFSIVFIAFVSLLLMGCKSEKKKPEVDPNLIQPEMSVNAQDTLEVRRLTKQYLHALQEKDLDGAIAMLRYYDKKDIVPLPLELEAKERMVLGMFLGMPSYDIDHIIFFRDDDSEVKYTVTMFERTDENDRRPNKASFLLRPVRHLGQWYLTLADKQTDKVKSQIIHKQR